MENTKQPISKNDEKITPPRPPTSFDLMSYMKEKAISFNKALDLAIPWHKEPFILFEPMRNSVLADKNRIRPTLCIASCELFGGQESTAMPVACTVECLHAASAMQEVFNFMDNESTRRGRPTSNQNHKASGDHLTILASDALTAVSIELITTKIKGSSPDRVLRAIGELAKSVGPDGLVGGQLLHMKLKDGSSSEMIGLEHLESVYSRKTGALLEGSVVSGAILGGASDEDIEKLRKYAKCIGLMLQVVDDILDFTKSSVDKATYPKVIGLEKSRELVEKLRKEAQEHIAGFDLIKAGPLFEMASYIADRANK